MVQHLMRQHEKYQTICDYTPTISHDMSVIHDIKRCETLMQKLQEIIFPEWVFFKTPEAITPSGVFIVKAHRLYVSLGFVQLPEMDGDDMVFGL